MRLVREIDLERRRYATYRDNDINQDHENIFDINCVSGGKTICLMVGDENEPI